MLFTAATGDLACVHRTLGDVKLDMDTDVSLMDNNMLSAAPAFMIGNQGIYKSVQDVWNSSLLHSSIFLNDRFYLFLHSVEGQKVMNIDSYVSVSDQDEGTAKDAWTPLHVAAFMGRVEYTDFLLRKGADISLATTRSKLTALHLAAAKGHSVIVEMLTAAIVKSNKFDCRLDAANIDIYSGDRMVRWKAAWEENCNDISVDSLEIDPCVDSP